VSRKEGEIVGVKDSAKFCKTKQNPAKQDYFPGFSPPKLARLHTDESSYYSPNLSRFYLVKTLRIELMQYRLLYS